MIGQCKLCLRDAELQDSHFLSKGIYKILRENDAQNPNPFSITRGAVIQTSRQLKSHLLCRLCENLLNEGGEKWVLTNCLQNDRSFPLADALVPATPKLASPDRETKVYHAAEIPRINVSKLSYFAASIFWRGSIYPWNEDGSVPVELGPFQERFRLFLLGEEEFPADSVLWVAVRSGRGSDKLTHVPVLVRKDGLHSYKFPMPGLAFTLIVSKNIPSRYRDISLVQGAGNPIIATSVLEGWLMQEGARALQASQGGSATVQRARKASA
ncbi:MAG: hypothetical protein WAN65_13120 [Candidatus Sulfotelmatobacter sp.]